MTKNTSLLLPALRGSFGDWIYYSCLVPMKEIGDRVRYADEIHPNKALSELIQRSLEGPRAKNIAEYLSAAKERFFNSLVLATYGGSPEWLEVGNFRTSSKSDLLEAASQTGMDTLGFLSLTGSEKIFAIDGQHRVAGIKRALENGQSFGQDHVPVIFVGHKKSASGLQRTRRLFTTLNKTAVPVRKRDIIALDEDDVMAIIARRLVETNPYFKDPKIAVIASQNIPAGNRVCLTTISSLYDILKQLFMLETGKQSDRTLRFNRPPDERLEKHYQFATDYFAIVAKSFKPIGDLFASKDPAEVTKANRGDKGGHLLFRPIGLDIFTAVSIEYAIQKNVTLAAAVAKLKVIPTDISSAPYRHVIWEPSKSIMIPDGKSLARNVLRYMLDLKVDGQKTASDYKLALNARGVKGNLALPKRLF